MYTHMFIYIYIYIMMCIYIYIYTHNNDITNNDNHSLLSRLGKEGPKGLFNHVLN